MAPTSQPPPWEEIDPFIEAYEKSQARHGRAELSAFLPNPAHPHFLAVLRELVRADLEYCWRRGLPRRAQDYLADFPVLRDDPTGLGGVAFEEYRQRQRAGERPSPAEYHARFGVETADWPVGGDGPEATPSPADVESAAAAYLTQRAWPPGAAEGADLAPTSALSFAESNQLFADLHRSDPEAAYRLARAVTSLPPPGGEFLGFRLVRELGRGAFGRVYLARQGDLADRPVALKVSGELRAEPQSLARLQHTNIVPVYSVHRAGPLQALCMPYFGATTFAHVTEELRKLPAPPSSGRWLLDLLETRSDASAHKAAHRLFSGGYVAVVLALTARLADGLAYAHERGILHQDLKPANVLLGDDGQPMLLDFNLAHDSTVRAGVPAAYVGGTLPYMAPEHLKAFRDGRPHADARSDVYALGLILYEVLTGELPFPAPAGTTAEKVLDIIASRRAGPPDLRRRNKDATPAVGSILRHCLEPDPARRYQSARQLCEDIELHLADRPLRWAPEPSWRERVQKWARRHPRLTSGYAIAVVGAVLLAGLGAAYAQRSRLLARAEAVNVRHEWAKELTRVRFLLGSPAADAQDLDAGIAEAEHALAPYPVLDNPNWASSPAVAALNEAERERLRGDLRELLLLLSRGVRLQALAGNTNDRAQRLGYALRLNELAEACDSSEQGLRAVRFQRALLLQVTGRAREADDLWKGAEALPANSARDLYLAAVEKMAHGDYAAARALLQQARDLEPQDSFVHYALGLSHAALGDYPKAAAALDASIALWPGFHGSHYQRGRVHNELKEHGEAVSEFGKALHLRPDFSNALVDRSFARLALKDYRAAEDDLNKALESGSAPTRAYFVRAHVRTLAGDREGAAADRAEGLRREPSDDQSWVVRGIARLGNKDREGALGDFDKALELNPRRLAALENRAVVLADTPGCMEKAVETLDTAIKFYPEYGQARASRGVLLARLDKSDEALRDAQEAERLDPRPDNLYRVAGIYALTSSDNADNRRHAFRLLSAALRAGYGFEYLDNDPELAPLRTLPEFKRIVEAARLLRQAGHDGQKKQ
jgi:serine/threonine protein kinase/tetratricopeptide (TPR) repeat protein